MYQAISLEAISEDDCLHNITTFEWLNDVAGHNAYATAASSFASHLFLRLTILLWRMINRKLLQCLLIPSLSDSIRNTPNWRGKPRHSYAVSGLA